MVGRNARPVDQPSIWDADGIVRRTTGADCSSAATPPQVYIRFASATNLRQPRIENHQLGPLAVIRRPVRLGRDGCGGWAAILAIHGNGRIPAGARLQPRISGGFRWPAAGTAS